MLAPSVGVLMLSIKSNALLLTCVVQLTSFWLLLGFSGLMMPCVGRNPRPRLIILQRQHLHALPDPCLPCCHRCLACLHNTSSLACFQPHYSFALLYEQAHPRSAKNTLHLLTVYILEYLSLPIVLLKHNCNASPVPKSEYSRERC